MRRYFTPTRTLPPRGGRLGEGRVTGGVLVALETEDDGRASQCRVATRREQQVSKANGSTHGVANGGESTNGGDSSGYDITRRGRPEYGIPRRHRSYGAP